MALAVAVIPWRRPYLHRSLNLFCVLGNGRPMSQCGSCLWVNNLLDFFLVLRGLLLSNSSVDFSPKLSMTVMLLKCVICRFWSSKRPLTLSPPFVRWISSLQHTICMFTNVLNIWKDNADIFDHNPWLVHRIYCTTWYGHSRKVVEWRI